MATKKVSYIVMLELLNSTTGAKWVDANPSNFILQEITIDLYKDGVFSETISPYDRLSDNLVTVILTGGSEGHTDADSLFLESNYSGSDNIIINPVQILLDTDFDSISITEPSGVATNFREMVVQTWMRFFNKVDKTSTQIRVYDAGGNVNTTQTHDLVAGTTRVDKAT